ncbi:MAG: chemotaxis protein CheW [Gemmatimonadetes bacterium]|nr:chemotaxis protein CheW [Gemmatimonadota bacterium]
MSATATLPTPAAARCAGKFLTFKLDAEEYGIEILKVQEIIGSMAITTVPGTPAFICGIANLRGKVIPIINLRRKFGMEDIDATTESCIIVVQVRGVSTGLVVDRVSEVVNIAGTDVEEVPEFGADVDTTFLIGVAKHAGRVNLLLDIDRVLSSADVADVAAITSAAAEG